MLNTLQLRKIFPNELELDKWQAVITPFYLKMFWICLNGEKNCMEQRLTTVK